jgi:hypothetical protein
MPKETEVEGLTREDVVEIVEEVLEKRERTEQHRGTRREAEDVIDVDLLAEKIGEKVGEQVGAAMDRHAIKQAEAHAKAEADRAEVERKAAAEKPKKGAWNPFAA